MLRSADSFGTRTTLSTTAGAVTIYSLIALEKRGFPGIARLPFSLKILLENLMRNEDGRFVKQADIVHQVNLEYLARVVMTADSVDGTLAFPDTLVGTDSHTTMVNGLGVVGWGVGGIEAEAAMLGQPSSMLIPPVLGVKLRGRLPEGTTATDLVLTITERLRKHGVVGKFVEFFGPGLEHLTLADRATLGNMCPEYGATI